MLWLQYNLFCQLYSYSVQLICTDMLAVQVTSYLDAGEGDSLRVTWQGLLADFTSYGHACCLSETVRSSAAIYGFRYGPLTLCMQVTSYLNAGEEDSVPVTWQSWVDDFSEHAACNMLPAKSAGHGLQQGHACG